MGLDDQVTCYSSTSAGAVNHRDGSDRSMEPEQERLMQTEERLGKGRPPACLLGLAGLKAVLEFALVKILSVYWAMILDERFGLLIFLKPTYWTHMIGKESISTFKLSVNIWSYLGDGVGSVGWIRLGNGER